MSGKILYHQFMPAYTAMSRFPLGLMNKSCAELLESI